MCVGLDSTQKKEMALYEDILLARGMATLCPFDGPGTGRSAKYDLPIRGVTYEVPVKMRVLWITSNPGHDLDASRIGIRGRLSLGGYYAAPRRQRFSRRNASRPAWVVGQGPYSWVESVRCRRNELSRDAF
jgi:hypothetical protein